MAGIQNFRSAFNGFKREDVVHYIEYMNNKHNAQIEQLNTQLRNAQAAQSELQAQLEEAQARCAELEAGVPSKPAGKTEDELEVYRRAERTERLARERAAQIYAQANAVLSDAALQVDAAAEQIGTVIDQVTEQLQNARETVGSTKTILQDATSALYAIRPEE